MVLSTIIDLELYAWLVLPVLIFLARVCDVSLGTVRVIFISKGFKYLAPIVGFFEILIWLLAMRQIMMNLSNPLCFVAYAGGFSLGNFTGIWIAEKLSLGTVILRIVTKREAEELIEALKSTGFGLTHLDAEGKFGPVKLMFIILPRNKLRNVVDIIKTFNPKAFYTVEDVNFVQNAMLPKRRKKLNFNLQRFFTPYRKSK